MFAFSQPRPNKGLPGNKFMKGLWLKLTQLCLLSVTLVPLCPSGARPVAQKERTAPTLLGRCEGNCLYDTLSQEYAFALADAAQHGRIAIRLCSNEKFEVAIAKASANLIEIADSLKKRGLTDLSDIPLLISDKCPTEGMGRVATEFWVIPSHAAPPTYDKLTSFTSVSITAVGEMSYHSKVREFVKHLRQEPGSYGVVVGYFFRRPSLTLRHRVREAGKLVRSNPDLKGRFTAALIPYGVIHTGYVEPKEPRFLVVQISKGD